MSKRRCRGRGICQALGVEEVEGGAMVSSDGEAGPGGGIRRYRVAMAAGLGRDGEAVARRDKKVFSGPHDAGPAPVCAWKGKNGRCDG